MELKTVYFENPGSENTEAVLGIAKRRAEELGIKTILVASTTGDTVAKAMEAFSGFKIIAVTHVTGYRAPNTQEFTDENRGIVKNKGGTILTTTQAFSGVSRAVRNKFHSYVIEDIIANTLRIFGEGMKVVCEIAMMAVDSGLVRTDEDVIAIGGRHRGADTVVVLRPVNTRNFFDIKVKEILCKPR